MSTTSDLPVTWRNRAAPILSLYRCIGLFIALVLLNTQSLPFIFNLSPVLISLFFCIYVLFKVVHPTRWSQPGAKGYSLLAIDVLFSVIIVAITGGIDSPFVLFSLAPVLSAALFMDIGTTVGVTGITVISVVFAHIWNPLLNAPMPDVSQSSVYIAAVAMAAVLPYLVNFNLRQQLHSQDVIEERQRLSRDLHDGVSQTLSALRWEHQLMEMRLAEKGIELKEARQVAKLIQRAKQESTDTIDLFSSLSSDDSFPDCLDSYLKQTIPHIDIEFFNESGREAFRLDTTVEFELLRICQEAVNNVWKHSGAGSAKVCLKKVNSYLQVTIKDDGCGSATLDHPDSSGQRKGHGLIGMKERARIIGAQFGISSVPGQGTEVRVQVPMNRR